MRGVPGRAADESLETWKEAKGWFGGGKKLKKFPREEARLELVPHRVEVGGKKT